MTELEEAAKEFLERVSSVALEEHGGWPEWVGENDGCAVSALRLNRALVRPTPEELCELQYAMLGRPEEES